MNSGNTKIIQSTPDMKADHVFLLVIAFEIMSLWVTWVALKLLSSNNLVSASQVARTTSVCLMLAHGS